MSVEEGVKPQPFELNGFLFQSSKLGCSQLLEVKKGEEFFSGKLIPNARLSEFLRLEGHVQKVLRAHPHPNLLQPLHVASGKDFSAVVLPPLGDDLHTITRASKGLREKEAKPLFHAILSAVHHCHKHRIVIRDLRLGKIFFKKGTREVVIADLDGAQVVSHSSPFLCDRKGSPAFVSPEVVVSHSYDGAAADMWALGVILYIMLTGTYPFRDTHPGNLFQKIQQGHSAVFFPPNMSEAARDIIRRLLVKEPHLRMTAEDLLKDLWFAAPMQPVPPKAFNPPPQAPLPAISPATMASTTAPALPTVLSMEHRKRACSDLAHASKRIRESEVELQMS